MNETQTAYIILEELSGWPANVPHDACLYGSRTHAENMAKALTRQRGDEFTYRVGVVQW